MKQFRVSVACEFSGIRVTVAVKVQLTAKQRERLNSITSADLNEIRNGVNPVTIYGVRQKGER